MWIDLEGIMLNEISQTEKTRITYHLCAETKTQKKLMNITKWKQNHREQTSGYQQGEKRRQYKGGGYRDIN